MPDGGDPQIAAAFPIPVRLVSSQQAFRRGDDPKSMKRFVADIPQLMRNIRRRRNTITLFERVHQFLYIEVCLAV
jgi:hypothetical protein